MENEQILYRLFQVVAYDLTHKHFKHVCDKATLYDQLVAGVGLDKLLKQYVRREDAALFEQRVNLTQHIVTAVCKNLLDVFYKVPRSSTARRTVSYKGEQGTAKKSEELEAVLSGFWGNSSFDNWLGTRFIELNATDPNAFVVFEWDEFDNTKERLQPRPFEVPSSAAVDFAYKNQVLQYLIVKNEHYYDRVKVDRGGVFAPRLRKPNEGQVKGSKFTLYGKDQTWQLLQVDENEAFAPTTEEGVVFAVNGLDADGKVVPRAYVKLGRKMYRLFEFLPHNAGKVPAFRVGYYRDLATKGETYVNPLHPAEPFLLKTITSNSHLDLVATLIAFPQMVKYGQKCPDVKCLNGHYADGSTCKTCNGSSVKSTSPSVQDAIVIKMPESREEAIPLDELITYLSPPVDVVKWQEAYIENLTQKAKRIMFNSDTFTKVQVAKTATGENLDAQNVYDTLYPFAGRFSKIFVFSVSVMAKLTDLDKDLVVGYNFGKDFKLKTLEMLIDSLVQVSTLNAPALAQDINNDIAEIIFAEKPTELQRFKLRQSYDPFKGKTDKEIAVLLAGNLVSKKDKVLYANFSRIFDELELEFAKDSKNFYGLNRAEQRQKIYEKVDLILAEIDAENPAPSLPIA